MACELRECHAQWITGAHVFSLALGGDIGDPLAHKAALLKLALVVAGRL